MTPFSHDFRLALGAAFPLCQSTEQAIIDKGRNPRFHNRAIDMKFAGEPVNKVWNWLDINRIQIFQQLRRVKGYNPPSSFFENIVNNFHNTVFHSLFRNTYYFQN